MIFENIPVDPYINEDRHESYCPFCQTTIFKNDKNEQKIKKLRFIEKTIMLC